MGFLDDIQAALATEGTSILAAMEPPNNLSSLGDFTFPSDVGLGGQQVFLDNSTGQRVTLAQALAMPNLTAADVQGLLAAVRASDPGGLTDTAPGGQTNVTPTPQQTTGFLQNIIKSFQNTPLKAIGTTVLAATGIGGLITAIVGMTRNADGSATIKLPDNRTVQLSPEERQLMDLAVTQAKQQAGISNLTLPVLASAAEAAAPDIMRLMSTGTKTAADQATAQGAVTGAANTAVAGAAPDIFAKDLASARALQTGVETPAIQNLSQLVAGDQPTAAETLSGRVGTTVDQRILDMIQDPEGVYQVATGQVAKGLKGDLPVNPLLARLLAEEEEKWKGRLQSELGPGYATSTPGERALLDFGQRKLETITNDNRTQTQAADALARGQVANLSAFSPVALGRLSFDEAARGQRFGRATAAAGTTGQGTNTIGRIFNLGQTGGPSPSGTVATLLGERPGTLALQNLSQVAGIGNAQAANELSVAQLNELLRRAGTSSLVQGGGNLFGMAASPFLSALSKSLFS